MTYTMKVVNGDIVRNPSGSGYVMISDKDKCKQDAVCILSTNVRKSNGLGCGLEEMIGRDADNPQSMYSNAPVMFEFQSKVAGGLSRLRLAQRSAQYSYRTVGEIIHDFSPVDIFPIAGDPRNYRWRVFIITIDGQNNISVRGRTSW